MYLQPKEYSLVSSITYWLFYLFGFTQTTKAVVISKLLSPNEADRRLDIGTVRLPLM